MNGAPRIMGRPPADEIQEAQILPLSVPLPKSVSLVKVAERLASNPASRYNTATLAKSAGMSERSFLRRFHQETGLSVGRWQQQLRVLVALNALAAGSSVTDASLEAGFKSVSAFIRFFTKATGQ